MAYLADKLRSPKEEPNYNYFSFWNARLFAQKKPDSDTIINEIVRQSNENLSQIEELVDNGAFEENEEVKFHSDHIRFPRLYFKLESSLGNIATECRIRINPCHASEYKEFYHSKIWIIISNTDSQKMSSDDIYELYKNSVALSETISEVVRKYQILSDKGFLEEAPYYNIIAKTMSIGEGFITDEMRDVLFTRHDRFRKKEYVSQFDKIQKIIRDLLYLACDEKMDDPLPFFIENYEKLTWKLVTAKPEHSNLLYCVSAEDTISNIAGIADIGKNGDVSSLLRKLFLPTALILTSYM